MKWAIGIALGLIVAAGRPAQADDIDAVEVMKQAHLNLYYAADDGKAVVNMVLTNKRGKTREREFIMYRLDLEDGGEQKYYTYFLKPGDVRRTAFMVWKDPNENDSRWIYVPAIDLVKRISANDKSSSFVGSDFSYEDVSGRHWSNDTHTVVRADSLEGRSCVVIESIPVAPKDSFSKKLSWIDDEYMLPVREEFYDKNGKLERVFEALAIEEIDGIRTVTGRKMTNVAKDHITEVQFREVAYDVGVEESLFTERYLKAPPAALVKQ